VKRYTRIWGISGANLSTALLHNLKHNKVLHEHNVILTIETGQTPRVDAADRVRMETTSDKFATVRLRFGFMESPNVPKALVIARKPGWQFDIMATSFFVSRRSLKPSAQSAAVAGSLVYRAEPFGQRRHRLLPNSNRTCG
jgi:K+ transporter